MGHKDALFLFHSLYIFLKLWHGSLCRPGSLNWDDNLLLSLLIGTRAQISEKRKMMSWLLRICSVCLHFYSSTVSPALLSCQSYPGDTFSIWQLGGLSDFLSSPVYDFRSWGWDTPSGNWTCGQGGCSESALWLQVSSLPPWQLLWTLEMLIANEGALSSFSWPISSPCLALEELVAELPLAHLNRLNLFKGFKSLHIKTSLMEVPHAFPLPTDNDFILLVLMSDFSAACCTDWARAPTTPRMEQLYKKRNTGQNNFFFSFNSLQNRPWLTSLRQRDLKHLIFFFQGILYWNSGCHCHYGEDYENIQRAETLAGPEDTYKLCFSLLLSPIRFLFPSRWNTNLYNYLIHINLQGNKWNKKAPACIL